MAKIQVLIVDDHPMMREALRTALADEPNLEIIGEAADGRQAVTLAEKLQPDVILMDLLMPGIDGLDAITEIFATNPEAKILVVTSLEDEDKVLAAVQAGALGYFPKTAPREYLLEAIRKVADGIPYLPAGIALKLISGLRRIKLPVDNSEEMEPLTSRQREILALLGQGQTDEQIGVTLKLQTSTVRSHLHNILQRLGLDTRAQAVAYANHQQMKI